MADFLALGVLAAAALAFLKAAACFVPGMRHWCRRWRGGVGSVAMTAGSVFAVGVGALYAAQPGDLTMSVESGKAALRRNNPVKAEAMFARAGDELGLAEALILQGRYDEASLLLERYPNDGKAWLFAALIARGKGDPSGGRALLQEAERMGSEEARDLLAAEVARG